MSSQLPPSKFGAGTTYGETGQAYSLPPSAPRHVPSPAPLPQPQHQPPPPPPPHGYAPDPYAMPAPDPYAGAPTQYPNPSPVAAPLLPAAGTASGTAVTAAILCLVGALWYGVDTIRNWDKFELMFQILGNSSAFGVGDGWAAGFLAAAIAQLVFVLLLLVGGIMLLARSSFGRGMAVLGAILVIAANGYLALAGFQTVSYLNDLAQSSGFDSVTRDDVVTSILLNTGLPALIAIVTLVLLMTSSTKQWCRRSPQITY